MSNPGRGGRGKKAPYETQHYRIPTPLKPAVAMLSAIYRQWVEETEDSSALALIKRLEDAITSNKNESVKPDNKFTKLASKDTELVKPTEETLYNIQGYARDKKLDEVYLEAYQNLIADKEMLEKEVESLQNEVNKLKAEREKTMSILAPALKFNANSGGKIKAAIREAFPNLAIK